MARAMSDELLAHVRPEEHGPTQFTLRSDPYRDLWNLEHFDSIVIRVEEFIKGGQTWAEMEGKMPPVLAYEINTKFPAPSEGGGVTPPWCKSVVMR